MSYAEDIAKEVMEYLEGIDVSKEGEHLWTNMETIAGIQARLEAIHAQISWLEITGQADEATKKVRTLIVDKAKETFKVLAAFESRKITGRKLEYDLANTSRLT
jgi:hypothetical protein